MVDEESSTFFFRADIYVFESFRPLSDECLKCCFSVMVVVAAFFTKCLRKNDFVSTRNFSLARG